MNNICIKPHIPKGEDGFKIPPSDSSISVTILLLNSLSVLSLITLLTAAVLDTYSNEGGTLKVFRWGAGTMFLNLTSSLGLPTKSILISLDTSVGFSSFYGRTTFLASSVSCPSPETLSLVSLSDRFGTCENKRGDEEKEGIIWGSSTGLFILNSSSELPTDSIIASPDKSLVFPFFSDTATLLASSVPYPSYDTFLLDFLISVPEELEDKLYIV